MSINNQGGCKDVWYFLAVCYEAVSWLMQGSVEDDLKQRVGVPASQGHWRVLSLLAIMAGPLEKESMDWRPSVTLPSLT